MAGFRRSAVARQRGTSEERAGARWGHRAASSRGRAVWRRGHDIAPGARPCRAPCRGRGAPAGKPRYAKLSACARCQAAHRAVGAAARAWRPGGRSSRPTARGPHHETAQRGAGGAHNHGMMRRNGRRGADRLGTKKPGDRSTIPPVATKSDGNPSIERKTDSTCFHRLFFFFGRKNDPRRTAQHAIPGGGFRRDTTFNDARIRKL